MNVEAQKRTPTSFLNWLRRMINVRKRYPAFGRGSLEFLTPPTSEVMAYMREYEGTVILVVTQLSRFVQYAELDMRRFAGYVPVELIGNIQFPPIGELAYFFTLGPHAFYWFRLDAPTE